MKVGEWHVRRGADDEWTLYFRSPIERSQAQPDLSQLPPGTEIKYAEVDWLDEWIHRGRAAVAAEGGEFDLLLGELLNKRALTLLHKRWVGDVRTAHLERCPDCLAASLEAAEACGTCRGAAIVWVADEVQA